MFCGPAGAVCIAHARKGAGGRPAGQVGEVGVCGWVIGVVARAVECA